MKETCPHTCLFLELDCEDLPLDGCYYMRDKSVEPFNLILEYTHGRKETVTVIGENEYGHPRWILLDGSRISKKAPWIK